MAMTTSQSGPAPPTSLQPLEEPAAHLLPPQGQEQGELIPIDQIQPSATINRRFLGGRMQATAARCRHPLLAHAFAPPSHASSSNVLESHAASIYDAILPDGQSTELRSVLFAIASASLSASVTASDIHQLLLDQTQDANSPQVSEADVLNAAETFVARPMCAVKVIQYDEVVEQDELAAVWQDLVRRVAPMDIDYVDDAVLALVVGVESVRQASVTGSAAFGLRRRYGLMVADNLLVDDEWNVGEHARNATSAAASSSIQLFPPKSTKAWPLFTTLPSLSAPLQRRQHVLAVPSTLATLYFTHTHAFIPRFRLGTGELALHGPARNYRVLAHSLVPPRESMDPQTKTGYLEVFSQIDNQQSIPLNVYQHFIDRGFGVWDLHASAQEMVARKSHSKSRLMAYLFTRPYFLIASMARDDWPELFHALLGVLDDPSMQIPRDAQLALLAGVECKGLEEPHADSHLPPESERQYALFERVALVVPAHPRLSSASSVPTQAHAQLDSRSASSLSSMDDFDVESAPSDSPAAQHPTTLLVEPPTNLALPHGLGTPSILKFMHHRFVSGTLYLTNSICNASPVLAHALIPPSPLSAVRVQRYTARLDACYKSGLLLVVYKRALTLGPMRSFTFSDMVIACDEQAAKIQYALDRIVARPVALAEHVLDIGEEQRGVWELLHRQKRAGATWPAKVALVKLLGLEIVGLEYPRAEDVMPNWAERRFVVRERWALVEAVGRIAASNFVSDVEE